MKDVMIDFEALGTGPNKCVCQVGAVYFDRHTGELGESFKANIDADSHIKLGGVVDGRTVYWWLSQSLQARTSILGNQQPVTEVMTNLNEFLKNSSRIWSHATFDFVTLTDTLSHCGITPSFSYRSGMDIRTLLYLSGTTTSSFAREGTHHDALDDAKHQVKYCVAALGAVKGNKQFVSLASKFLD